MILSYLFSWEVSVDRLPGSIWGRWKDYQEFRNRKAIIAFIAPLMKWERLRDYWQKENLPFLGIPDPDGILGKLYGQEWNLIKPRRMPALFVVDRKGTIVFSQYAKNMTDIPENQDLFKIPEGTSNWERPIDLVDQGKTECRNDWFPEDEKDWMCTILGIWGSVGGWKDLFWNITIGDLEEGRCYISTEGQSLHDLAIPTHWLRMLSRKELDLLVIWRIISVDAGLQGFLLFWKQCSCISPLKSQHDQ